MKRVSVNVTNATTLSWEEEHPLRYLQPGDVVKVPTLRPKKEEE